MSILLVDTSGEYAVVALADMEGVLLASHVFAARRMLSQRLLLEVDSLLKAEKMDLTALTAYGVGIGPGSFTGVRVGVTTMKTWAQITDKPLLALPTLDACAAGVGMNATTRLLAAPSRRGEAYIAEYLPGEFSAQPAAQTLDDVQIRISSLSPNLLTVFCGTVEMSIPAARLVSRLAHVPPQGLADLAARMLRAGKAVDPLALAPLYVVAPSISTPKERTMI